MSSGLDGQHEDERSEGASSGKHVALGNLLAKRMERRASSDLFKVNLLAKRHMALLGGYIGLRLVWICPHKTLISERNEVLELTERGLIQQRLYCVLWECCW